MVFADIIKLKILKGRDYPELSRWVLNQSVFIRKRQRRSLTQRREGEVKTAEINFKYWP